MAAGYLMARIRLERTTTMNENCICKTTARDRSAFVKMKRRGMKGKMWATWNVGRRKERGGKDDCGRRRWDMVVRVGAFDGNSEFQSDGNDGGKLDYGYNKEMKDYGIDQSLQSDSDSAREALEHLVGEALTRKVQDRIDGAAAAIDRKTDDIKQNIYNKFDSFEIELKKQIMKDLDVENDKLSKSVHIEKNRIAEDSERRQNDHDSSGKRIEENMANNPVRPTKELVTSVLLKYWAVKTVFAPSTIQLVAALMNINVFNYDSTILLAESFVLCQVIQTILVWILYKDSVNESNLMNWPRYKWKIEQVDETSIESDKGISWVKIGVAGGIVALAASYSIQKLSEVIFGTVAISGPSNEFMSNILLSSGGDRATLALVIIMLGLLSPVAEEMIFRGFLQPTLNTKVSPETSILLTALIFAIFHTPWSVQPTMFVLGSIFGYVLHSSKGNLNSCTLSHMIYNVGVVSLYVTETFN